MLFGFEDSLRDLKKELKAAGADLSFVKEWQKSYDKVRKQSAVLKEQYTLAKKNLQTVCTLLETMEQKLIGGASDLSAEAKQLKQYRTGFDQEFLIGKEDKEFHLTLKSILALCEQKSFAPKDRLILQSEVENLLAVTKEALQKNWPSFRAMAYFYIDRTDQDITELPHADKVAKVQRLYVNEFLRPMVQVLQSALGDERAGKIMEDELWI